MSTRILVLTALSLATIVAGIIGLARLGSGDRPGDSSSILADAAAAAPTIAGPTATTEGPPAAPGTSGPPQEAPPMRPGPTVDVGAGTHQVCRERADHLDQLAALDPDQNEVGRLAAPLQEAFYRQTAAALEGDVAAALERMADQRLEHIAFWSSWDWDLDALVLETARDPDAEHVQQPLPDRGDLQIWQDWLTEWCGLDFVGPEGHDR